MRIPATAVLIRFRRVRELAAIERHLRAQGFAEVLVHDNSGPENCFTYGRYLAAARASHPVIYTQDDDCLVQNIPALLRAFDGTRLVNALKPGHFALYPGRESLVGWGAFFRREWTSVFERYRERYGEDRVLHRGADRIFTSLLPTPHRTLQAQITEFPTATAPFALYRQPDHASSRELALARVQSLTEEAVPRET